mmetsp:Transcript_7207/g.10971  ORF Transcript_7207/g.10971 Transcript_7207/m.10971 type:complete len:335 (-) Transcript_7207:55-1059(-)
MKISAASLLAVTALCAAVATDAWITTNTNTNNNRCSDVSLMASRGQIKWGNKKAWLEKRGFSEDGTALNASGGATASQAVSIIGGGRIGGMLADGGESTLLGREDTVDPNGEGPILVATRNDSLEGIVEACPENRRKDLVFMQNGYLDDFLESKGLMDNTQVLLFVSVTAKGAEPIDGVTTVNPEGLTAATGEHAQAFADRLAALDLKCNVISAEEYRPAMFEKLIWISTYMLVGAAKECSSVGQAGADHAELVEKVVNELVAAVSAKEGITFSEGVMARLAAYTDVVTDFPCAVKEFEWRNQYFYNLGDDACPTHNELLRECGEKGFLGFELL